MSSGFMMFAGVMILLSLIVWFILMRVGSAIDRSMSWATFFQGVYSVSWVAIFLALVPSRSNDSALLMLGPGLLTIALSPICLMLSASSWYWADEPMWLHYVMVFLNLPVTSLIIFGGLKMVL